MYPSVNLYPLPSPICSLILFLPISPPSSITLLYNPRLLSHIILPVNPLQQIDQQQQTQTHALSLSLTTVFNYIPSLHPQYLKASEFISSLYSSIISDPLSSLPHQETRRARYRYLVTRRSQGQFISITFHPIFSLDRSILQTTEKASMS